jgi:gamma-glutamyltranspeptidase / glutathione hydrolase
MRRRTLGTGRLAVLFVAAVGLALTAPAVARSDRDQGRSMVITQNGIVAAESPLAAQAGVAMLERGGNAVDAAVAANAVMGVVAPMSNGLGGDLFAIVYDAKSGALIGLNASGWSPAALSAQRLRDKGITRMPLRGIDSVTVPGVVDGWQKLLDRFGHKTLAEVLAPAIQVADGGFPVTEWIASLWRENAGAVRRDPDAARVYLPGGQPPHVGQMFRNADLAASLRLLASGGRDAFYRGDLARRIVAASTARGGTMTLDDLSGFSGEWVTPLSTTYRDWAVYELPPNGQGVAALEMLNIMERFPFGTPPASGAAGPGQFGLNQVDALHAMIEAKKLAYADLQQYIGDPAKDPAVGKAASTMVSKTWAASRAKLIDMTTANCRVAAGTLPPGGDTIYLSVVDRDGNMVSLIQSNYENFGSGIVVPGTGFVLQDRGALFNLDPGAPDELAGHKRPLHTIIPAFMTHGDERIAFGIMGGWNQSQAHAQFVSHIVDYGQNIQEAMETARFTKISFGGCDVQLEDRVPAGVPAALEARGHVLTMHTGFSNAFGGGQAVMRDVATGVNYGASDPRKDGEAIPEIRQATAGGGR